MPNETYGLIVRAWTTTESLRVIVVVSYTFTTTPESNITLHPAEVEIEVRNKVDIMFGRTSAVLLQFEALSITNEKNCQDMLVGVR